MKRSDILGSQRFLSVFPKNKIPDKNEDNSHLLGSLDDFGVHPDAGFYAILPANKRTIIFCISSKYNGFPLSKFLATTLDHEVYVYRSDELIKSNLSHHIEIVECLNPDLIIFSIPKNYEPKKSNVVDGYVEMLCELSNVINQKYGVLFLDCDQEVSKGLLLPDTETFKQPISFGKLEESIIPVFSEKIERCLSTPNYIQDQIKNLSKKNMVLLDHKQYHLLCSKIYLNLKISGKTETNFVFFNISKNRAFAYSVNKDGRDNFYESEIGLNQAFYFLDDEAYMSSLFNQSPLLKSKKFCVELSKLNEIKRTDYDNRKLTYFLVFHLLLTKILEFDDLSKENTALMLVENSLDNAVLSALKTIMDLNEIFSISHIPSKLNFVLE